MARRDAKRRPVPRPRKKWPSPARGGKAGDGPRRETAGGEGGATSRTCSPLQGEEGAEGDYGGAWMPSFSSSSSWMMIRGVTIIIRLCVSRPMPTFLNSRLM